MKVLDTGFDGLILMEPKVFHDFRGYFFESFNKKLLSEMGIDPEFKQDNQSLSEKNVLRGLHFQAPPYEQGKLVRVVKGSVIDVVVDIRKTSSTYGKHYIKKLSEENKLLLWIPPGFAHGFLSLEENTLFIYKCTQYYNQLSEQGLLWNDHELNINWNIKEPVISPKDTLLPQWRDFVSPF